MPIADIDHREYFTTEKIDALKKMFDKMDVNNEGSLSENDVYIMFKKLGKSLSRQQLREVLRYVDVDQSGTIEFEELCILEIKMSRARPRADLIDFRNYLDHKTIRMLEEYFVRHDPFGRGTIAISDLDRLLESPSVKVTQEEVDEILNEVDKEGTGELEFGMFASMWAVLTKRRKRVNYREFLSFKETQDLRHMFNDFDSRNSGALLRGEVDLLLKRLGFSLKKTQLNHLIRDFDTNMSNDIDFEEFAVMMLRIRGLKRNRIINPDTCDCVSLWRDEQFTVSELQMSGFSLRAFQEIGIPVAKIYSEGAQIGALDFRRAGYTAAMLRKGGLGVSELRAAGYSLLELQEAGFSAAAIAAANKALYNALSTGNLSVLPQQRPTAYTNNTEHVNVNALRPVRWVDRQPLTPRIREHCDWQPRLAREPEQQQEQQQQQHQDGGFEDSGDGAHASRKSSFHDFGA